MKKFYKRDRVNQISIIAYLQQRWETYSRSSSPSSGHGPSFPNTWARWGFVRTICSTVCNRATVRQVAVRGTWPQGATWSRCSEDRPVARVAPTSAWIWHVARGRPVSIQGMDLARSRLAGRKEGKACYWTALSTFAFLSKELSLAVWRFGFRLSVSGTIAWTPIEEESLARFLAELVGRYPDRVGPRTCCAWQEAWRAWTSAGLGQIRCPGLHLRSLATRYPWIETRESLRFRNCSRLYRELEGYFDSWLIIEE